MTTTLTLGECFVSDMDWEATEVRVEEMEWETSYIQVSEPMDWEDIPQVRASKRSKVSEPVIVNVPLQDEAVPPQPKKVSSPLEPKTNLSFQVKQTSSTPKKEGPIFYRSASEGDVARFDFPGAVQNVYIRSERRKDSLRGTTGSRPPSGVPRATLFSYKR
ncbi:hypothetical protein TNCV_3501451 [Trichonephila clavipes]|uniref:Uncharacterized protein n=1 Tax=Trichonephila clavipes TaxID=2585209 RepID=A0A8X6S3L7_TRICX|nr:hypothetical protein TNCV_3501451 [Trichonephila clavipes]